ncbi:hypothetical protein T484DRAFT_1756649 [Baffinella frigidus]|nr:hypothetical protein T484DRAFT_1756649 [Cryptophyta sp. CCMP2293]
MSARMMNIMRTTTSNDDLGIPLNTIHNDQDRATHNMNYHLLVIFHKDLENRPCRPVLSIVHLNSKPEALRTEILSNPRGSPIITTCQLCDPSINTANDLAVDPTKILCICTVSITDDEANAAINNVALLNTHTSQPGISLTQRSNIVLVPMPLHRYIPTGMGSIRKVKTAKTATDVELGVLVLRESINKARSLYARLSRLHAAFSTPENFYDAISLFTRKLDVFSFNSGAFRYTIPP